MQMYETHVSKHAYTMYAYVMYQPKFDDPRSQDYVKISIRQLGDNNISHNSTDFTTTKVL